MHPNRKEYFKKRDTYDGTGLKQKYPELDELYRKRYLRQKAKGYIFNPKSERCVCHATVSKTRPSWYGKGPVKDPKHWVMRRDSIRRCKMQGWTKHKEDGGWRCYVHRNRTLKEDKKVRARFKYESIMREFNNKIAV